METSKTIERKSLICGAIITTVFGLLLIFTTGYMTYSAYIGDNLSNQPSLIYFILILVGLSLYFSSAAYGFFFRLHKNDSPPFLIIISAICIFMVCLGSLKILSIYGREAGFVVPAFFHRLFDLFFG
jgi:hypothetical protein